MESLLRFPGNKQLKFLRVFSIAVLASICVSFVLSQYLWSPPVIPLSGGETTVSNRTHQGFGQPAPNLSEKELALHIEGDRAFEATFVTAPALVNAGLGPLFNNSSCVACHVGDGRGMPAKGNLLVRVSLPVGHSVGANQPISASGTNKRQSSLFASQPQASVTLGNAPPVPRLGTQIQDQAVFGVKPKADVEFEFQEQSGTYGDGQPYKLRSPVFKITLPDGKPLPNNVLTSPRVPPPVFGRGLLEAIPEKPLLPLPTLMTTIETGFQVSQIAYGMYARKL